MESWAIHHIMAQGSRQARCHATRREPDASETSLQKYLCDIAILLFLRAASRRTVGHGHVSLGGAFAVDSAKSAKHVDNDLDNGLLLL